MESVVFSWQAQGAATLFCLYQIYERYETTRSLQIERYKQFIGPARNSTVCRTLGCRRVFGRKGFIFCTEGCTQFERKAGDPAPYFEEHDIDDNFDASSVLFEVLGPPPGNVVIRRWRWDPEKGENVLHVFPNDSMEGSKNGNENENETKLHGS